MTVKYETEGFAVKRRKTDDCFLPFLFALYKCQGEIAMKKMRFVSGVEYSHIANRNTNGHGWTYNIAQAAAHIVIRHGTNAQPISTNRAADFACTCLRINRAISELWGPRKYFLNSTLGDLKSRNRWSSCSFLQSFFRLLLHFIDG